MRYWSYRLTLVVMLLALFVLSVGAAYTEGSKGTRNLEGARLSSRLHQQGR